MRTKRYSRFIVPNFLKWVILGLCLILISCFIYAAFLYHDIVESKTAGFSQIKEKVIDETELTTVKKITRFDGKKAYYVLYGSTKNEEKKIVFAPIESNKNLTIIDTKDIISKEDMKTQWENQCDNCKLVEITPAMIDQKPLWEITYRDSSDRYIFDYLSIYDGERFQQFRLKSMYN